MQFGNPGYVRSRNLSPEAESYVRSPVFRKRVREIHPRTDLWFDPWLRCWYIVFKTDVLYEVFPGRYGHHYRLKKITDPRQNLEEVRLSFLWERADFRRDCEAERQERIKTEATVDEMAHNWAKEDAKHLIGPTVSVPREFNGYPD